MGIQLRILPREDPSLIQKGIAVLGPTHSTAEPPPCPRLPKEEDLEPLSVRENLVGTR